MYFGILIFSQGSYLLQTHVCGTQCCYLEATFYTVMTEEGTVRASKDLPGSQGLVPAKKFKSSI